MLVEEAQWIKKVIENNFYLNDFPLLNVGSSTKEFRESVQPFIFSEIFKPLEDKNYSVLHTDIKEDNGVDIVGDLNDAKFRIHLRENNIKSILCSNLLEHLEDPQQICNSILEIVPINGLILVTVPYSFPYHNDPIDTLLRPNIKELHAFFPNTEILESEIVVSNNSFYNDLMNNKKYFLKMIIRWLLPFYKYSEWKYSIKDTVKLKKKYSATCVLLKRVN
jgi:hypothetical protein